MDILSILISSRGHITTNNGACLNPDLFLFRGWALIRNNKEAYTSDITHFDGIYDLPKACSEGTLRYSA